MRRSALLLCFLLALAPAASAHDVSDSEAFASYYVEMQGQAAGVIDVYGRYQRAASTIEKGGILDELRAAIDATIEHMATLDRRECFEPLAATYDDYWTALTLAFHTDTTPDEQAGYFAQATSLGSRFNALTLAALRDCAPDTPPAVSPVGQTPEA